MGLFKKKPGGTFVGNLLRTAANKATGGIMGTGANRIPVGGTATPVSQGAAPLNTTAAIDIFKSAVGEQPAVQSAIKAGIWEKYKAFIIAGGVALVGLLVYAFRKPQKRYR